MFINAKVGLYFIKLKDKPFFKEKSNIMARLKKKEGIILRNIWNWFRFILRGKMERIYYVPHFKITPLPKYLFFVF